MRLALALLLGCVPAPSEPLANPGGAARHCGDVSRPAPAPCRGDAFATVETVVDGDTIDVRLDDGGSSRVRLIGIDAPEFDEGACGGGAEEHLATLLPAGARVRLSFDAECRDAYHRDLAYVWSGDELCNATMLAGGFAQACPFPPNTAYADLFACLESRAEADSEGLWAPGCHRDACFR